MITLATNVLSIVLGISTPVTLLTSVPRDTWKPEVGDRLIVDTNDNMGYLIHPDGVYLEFKVATGQRRVVRYIGRTYDATTPEESWVAKSLHIKADRITFGPNGHFLRLYRDSTTNSPYGIHGHAYSERMLAQDVRFESMGCVIVSDELMSIIEDTWRLNGEQLSVVTVFGLGSKEIALQ
ncbi:MAG: L,D-transpeptidase family protein [Patescibacteria group bacterium]